MLNFSFNKPLVQHKVVPFHRAAPISAQHAVFVTLHDEGGCVCKVEICRMCTCDQTDRDTCILPARIQHNGCKHMERHQMLGKMSPLKQVEILARIQSTVS